MVNSFKLVSFPTESKMQIGKTTYLINSYFNKIATVIPDFVLCVMAAMVTVRLKGVFGR